MILSLTAVDSSAGLCQVVFSRLMCPQKEIEARSRPRKGKRAQRHRSQKLHKQTPSPPEDFLAGCEEAVVLQAHARRRPLRVRRMRVCALHRVRSAERPSAAEAVKRRRPLSRSTAARIEGTPICGDFWRCQKKLPRAPHCEEDSNKLSKYKTKHLS